MCSAELLQSGWRRGRPRLHVGWVWYHPTSPQHRRLGSLQLGKTSLDYSLYECYDIPSLLYSNIVARVSDALPSVHIHTLIYVFHSIGVFHPGLVPFRTGNSLQLRYDRPDRGQPYFVVAAVFEFGTCGTGEVGEGHIEKELEFLYWY